MDKYTWRVLFFVPTLTLTLLTLKLTGRPKKCAQCGPPITALRTEQDQKLAAQCACHEAPTVLPTAPSTNGVGSPRREPFRIVLQNFYRPGIPQKAFTFLRYTLFGLFILGATLPGPDPVLLSSANSCVDRRTSDDSIALRGKNLCFLIFNWFYGTLLIVLGVCVLKLDYNIKRFILWTEILSWCTRFWARLSLLYTSLIS